MTDRLIFTREKTKRNETGRWRVLSRFLPFIPKFDRGTDRSVGDDDTPGLFSKGNLNERRQKLRYLLVTCIDKLNELPRGKGGYSQKNWVGALLPKSPTLFMTEICDFPSLLV